MMLEMRSVQSKKRERVHASEILRERLPEVQNPIKTMLALLLKAVLLVAAAAIDVNVPAGWRMVDRFYGFR
jgi:hypothetical protein